MRMRKRSGKSTFVRVAAVVIALCMVAALALPAFAAESSAAAQDDPYTYTVRIFPGDKGTIDDSTDPFIKKEVAPGYQWSRSDFDYRYQAKSKTEKYSVTGMRESGKDNNTNRLYAGGAFTVDRDIDLVISYGIRGSEVAYTVRYLEYGTNAVLHEPETFYGNVGEKPVVSYLHVEGYTPQYRNLTGTLDADASKNKWTFYYVKNEAPVQEETPQESETEETGNTTPATS